MVYKVVVYLGMGYLLFYATLHIMSVHRPDILATLIAWMRQQKWWDKKDRWYDDE